MRAFVSASVVGGSFVVGIGVGDSGGSGREKLRFFFPCFLPPTVPPTQESRRWSTMADEESARLWQVNRTIHELVKDRVSTQQIQNFKLVNSSLCSPGIPSLGRRNRDGTCTVQTDVRESDGSRRVCSIPVPSYYEIQH